MHRLFLLSILLLAGCSQENSPATSLNSKDWILPSATSPVKVRFSLLNTANGSTTSEAFMVAGGDLFRQRQPVYNSILIQHPQGVLLFDAGLGSRIEQEMSKVGMIDRWLLAYQDLSPAAEQLLTRSINPLQINAIIPSHLHWDHISGARDFSGVPVLIAPGALQEAKTQAELGETAAFLSDTLGSDINWQALNFSQKNYGPFEQSLDYFADGSVIIVPLAGHTMAHVGLILNLPTGDRYFFIGDAAWLSKGVDQPSARPWLVRKMLEADQQLTFQQLEKIHQVQKNNQRLTVVPAHDDVVSAKLPQFPNFFPQF